MSWITSRRERWTWGNRTFMQPVYVHLPKLTEGYLFFFRIASWAIPIMSCYAGDLTLGQTVESSWITFVIWCGYVPLYWQQLGSQRRCLGSVDFCLQPRGQARQDRNGGGQEMVKRCPDVWRCRIRDRIPVNFQRCIDLKINHASFLMPSDHQFLLRYLI